MSQAAVDLPDHLDKSTDPLADPDDLLSQMAGNEIDRLLAEADAKPAPAARPPAATEDSNDVSSQLDNLFDELKTQDKQGADSPADAVSAEKLSESVDAELAEKPDTTPEGLEREAMLKAAGFENGADHAAAAENAEGPASTERSSLLAAAGFESGDDDDTDADDESLENEWIAPLPMYLKPLEWINAPFDSLPQRMREILGKVAIVTLVNAIAVLGYLLIFRKH